jgi:hypothetical protein
LHFHDSTPTQSGFSVWTHNKTGCAKSAYAAMTSQGPSGVLATKMNAGLCAPTPYGNTPPTAISKTSL